MLTTHRPVGPLLAGADPRPAPLVPNNSNQRVNLRIDNGKNLIKFFLYFGMILLNMLSLVIMFSYILDLKHQSDEGNDFENIDNRSILGYSLLLPTLVTVIQLAYGFISFASNGRQNRGEWNICPSNVLYEGIPLNRPTEGAGGGYLGRIRLDEEQGYFFFNQERRRFSASPRYYPRYALNLFRLSFKFIWAIDLFGLITLAISSLLLIVPADKEQDNDSYTINSFSNVAIFPTVLLALHLIYFIIEMKSFRQQFRAENNSDMEQIRQRLLGQIYRRRLLALGEPSSSTRPTCGVAAGKVLSINRGNTHFSSAELEHRQESDESSSDEEIEIAVNPVPVAL